MLQPKSPIEVLANRIPHANGVTWVFHDLATGFVRHVNVPPVAQQQPSQSSAQGSHGNEMVLYNHHPINPSASHTDCIGYSADDHTKRPASIGSLAVDSTSTTGSISW